MDFSIQSGSSSNRVRKATAANFCKRAHMLKASENNNDLLSKVLRPSPKMCMSLDAWPIGSRK